MHCRIKLEGNPQKSTRCPVPDINQLILFELVAEHLKTSERQPQVIFVCLSSLGDFNKQYRQWTKSLISIKQNKYMKIRNTSEK